MKMGTPAPISRIRRKTGNTGVKCTQMMHLLSQNTVPKLVYAQRVQTWLNQGRKLRPMSHQEDANSAIPQT